MRRIRVAVPVPGLEALTYELPEGTPAAAPGARVLVPLGPRVITGVVMGEPENEEEGGVAPAGADGPALRAVVDVLDPEPFLPPDVLQLAAWVAEYYACGIGEAIGAALPPRTSVQSERHARLTETGAARLPAERGVRKEILSALRPDRPVTLDALPRSGAHAAVLALEREGLIAVSRPLAGSASAFRTVRVAHLTAQGLEAEGTPEVGNGRRLGAKQAHALRLLAAAPDGLDAAVLSAQGIESATLNRLRTLGFVTFSRRQIDRDPFAHAAADGPAAGRTDVTLTPEQDAALERLRSLAATRRFSTTLLHGVTGSGKTELYLRLARDVAADRGVLLLVPEIALTPAMAAAFRATFGARVAIQHSGLSDGERHDQWHRIRRGDVDVVVGTRSAVFAPVCRLGLIIVDEEHDGSYKQEESPRYHARDVAVVRGRALDALVVLGSATPSLESYHNASTSRYTLVTLRRRVLDRPMADVRIVDMREEYAAHGPDVIVSEPLAAAIRDRVERREQAIVLLNRRGFATSVFCRQCGATSECPNCSVTLTVHRAARRARCHYCNYAIRVPTACAQCAGLYLEQAGYGTERVEAEVGALVPGARVARVDRDTIRRRGAITSLLRQFARREIDVLVGTQMIAKGHDFPRVTLVGVISADVGLGLADFRAAERTFQLLTQVVGRAGRGDIVGEAIVQTIHPDHYSIRHACRQDYTAFYEQEIAFRRAMQYPPAVSMINAVVKGGALDAALGDARELADAVRWGGEPFRVLGPAPAPLSKMKGDHRAQFFLKGTHRGAMRKALLSALEARPEIKRRTIVDVDPVSLL